MIKLIKSIWLKGPGITEDKVEIGFYTPPCKNHERWIIVENQKINTVTCRKCGVVTEMHISDILNVLNDRVIELEDELKKIKEVKPMAKKKRKGCKK